LFDQHTGKNHCDIIFAGEAVLRAVTSGSKQFFLGTDSAPHEKHTKETSCGCAGVFNATVALAVYARAFEEVRIKHRLSFYLF
jgi:dihydroorotase